MTVELRAATARDLPVLSEMETRLFPHGPWSEGALSGHLAAGHTLSLLLFCDGVPAGYLLAGFSPPEGELYRIGVLPAYRRNGYGRRLLSAFFEEADRRGADTLYLEVRESNTAARALYGATGFVGYCRRDNYYRDPCEAALLLRADRRKG